MRGPRKDWGPVFSTGPVESHTDPNPVIEKIAPKSTAVMQSAALLCDMMGVKYKVAPSEEENYQRWGSHPHSNASSSANESS